MYIYIYLAQTITTSSHGLVTFEMVVNSKVNPLQNPPKQLKLRDFFPTICPDTYTKVQTPMSLGCLSFRIELVLTSFLMGKGCKNKDQTLLVMYDMYDMYDMYESWVPDLNASRLFSQFVSPLSKERGCVKSTFEMSMLNNCIYKTYYK